MTKVAAIQMHVTEDCAANEVFDMIDHAAKLGVKVLALPEYAFLVPRRIPTAAEASCASPTRRQALLVESRSDRRAVINA